MKKEECCSIFMITLMVAIPAGAIIALLFDVFGKAIFAEYGSFMAGIIAFIAAFIAFYSQKQSTQIQVDAQRRLESERLRISKIEELYSIVEGLRIKIILTRPDKIKDTVTDIDVLIHDLSRIIMLCKLHMLVDDNLFHEYKISVDKHLQTWKSFADKVLIKEMPTKNDFDSLHKNMMDFLNNTEKFLEHLVSLRRLSS